MKDIIRGCKIVYWFIGHILQMFGFALLIVLVIDSIKYLKGDMPSEFKLDMNNIITSTHTAYV